MHEGGFNRQAFVKQHERSRREPNSLAPLFFVIVGLGLLGMAGYMYVSANGLPDLNLGGSDPNLAQMAARLEEIENRLEEIEKRRSRSSAIPPQPQEPADATEPEARNLPAAAPATAQNPAKESRSRGAEGGAGETDKQVGDLRQKYQSLQGDVVAVRQAWEASTDQLSTVAGTLSRQHGEIESNREKLMRLSDHFDRTPLAFDLRRGRRARVGPISLSLHKIHEKTQRYTLRAIVNDKSIELKDRALLEPVELYLSDATPPLELVVTEIRDNQVSGILRVPRQLANP